MLNFADPATMMSSVFAFLEHWYGPRQASYGIPSDELDELVPKPLRDLLEFAGRWPDHTGRWFLYDSVPNLHTKPYLSTEFDGHAVVASYLGMSTTHAAISGDDPPVIELDVEDVLHDDSLTHYLTRLVMRQLASNRHRWGPVAGYDDVARAAIANTAPLIDASLRVDHPGNDSTRAERGENTEVVWLLEDGDVLAYHSSNDDAFSFAARTDHVLAELIERHGASPYTLIQLELGGHPDLARGQWTLRIMADGSATLGLAAIGGGSAYLPPGTLDFEQVLTVLNDPSSTSPEPVPQTHKLTLVRPHEASTPVHVPTRVTQGIVLQVVGLIDQPVPEFDEAWDQYRPTFD